MGIAGSLASLMDGKITVESRIGVGSTFTAYLTQRLIKDSIAIGREVSAQLQSFSFSHKASPLKGQLTHEHISGNVLIVDDVIINLLVAKGLIEPYGISIKTALSGFEAIEMMKKEAFDIIFMDHMMPEMDGVEAVSIIRQNGYKGIIVALTANAVTGQMEILLENGFDDFISKPIDTQQLDTILNKYIGKMRRVKSNGINDAEILKFFCSDSKKMLTAVEAFYKDIENATDEDRKLFVINAHALKATLATIGEVEASQLALLLEASGREGNKDVIKAKAQEFVDTVNNIIKSIDDKNISEGIVTAEDTGYLNERLRMISEACKNYDFKTTEKVLSDLRQKQWTKKTEEMIDKIGEYVLHSDFEELAEFIEGIGA